MQEAVFIIFVNIAIESKSEIYKNSFKLRWNTGLIQGGYKFTENTAFYKIIYINL